MSSCGFLIIKLPLTRFDAGPQFGHIGHWDGAPPMAACYRSVVSASKLWPNDRLALQAIAGSDTEPTDGATTLGQQFGERDQYVSGKSVAIQKSIASTIRYNEAMRRLLAILLMLLVPLQITWSATESLHGHQGNEGSVSGFHFHDDDHGHDHDPNLGDHDDCDTGVLQQGHNDDGHHDGHYHPVFSMLVFEPQLNLGAAPPYGLPTRPPSSFTSHIPSLFDWPPSVQL